MTYFYRDEPITLTEPNFESVRELPGGEIEVRDGDAVVRLPYARGERGTIEISWDGRRFVFTPAARIPTNAPKSGTLSAPMAGVVADVMVSVGERVDAYQPLAVVEAMKVLATLESPRAGVVGAILARKGQRVEQGAPLISLAPESER